MKNNTLIVNFKEGLHARPATKFVQIAKDFEANIKVITNDKSADAKSILEILTLGVMQGMEIIIQAEGADEVTAVKQLSDFIQTSS